MSSLGAFDIAASAVILALGIYGLVKGVARMVLGVIGLALGWVLAVRYCESVAPVLGARPALAPAGGPDLHRLAAFALIFAAVILAATLLSWLVTRALGAMKLGGLNRMAGAGLGLLAAILLICASTVPLLALLPSDGGALMSCSILAPYAVAGGDYLKDAAPEPLRSRFTAASRKMFAAAMGGGGPESVSGPRRAPAPRPR